MSQLNSQQQQAVEHLDGPLLVLAGAGSGKTRIVTQRIIKLLENGVSPYSILAVTFTNKAAEEMKRRVEKETRHSVIICTFHALGVRILREHNSNFVIYDEDDALRVIAVVMKEFMIDLGQKGLG